MEQNCNLALAVASSVVLQCQSGTGYSTPDMVRLILVNHEEMKVARIMRSWESIRNLNNCLRTTISQCIAAEKNYNFEGFPIVTCYPPTTEKEKGEIHIVSQKKGWIVSNIVRFEEDEECKTFFVTGYAGLEKLIGFFGQLALLRVYSNITNCYIEEIVNLLEQDIRLYQVQNQEDQQEKPKPNRKIAFNCPQCTEPLGLTTVLFCDFAPAWAVCPNCKSNLYREQLLVKIYE